MKKVETFIRLACARLLMLSAFTSMLSVSAQNPDIKTLPATQPSTNASPLDQYSAEMRRKIKQVWAPRKDAEDSTVVVAFKISKEGILSNLRLVTPSGVKFADRAALRAVEQAAPFPPLPSSVGDTHDFEMKFGKELWKEKEGQ